MDGLNRNWQPVILDGELLGAVKIINIDEGFFANGGKRFLGQ